ncbi:MAG TPA: hypothetical protein VGK94_13560 [Candidatus Polarisedimenticolia bacterium]|jgi:high-affinity nickel-transport protein
MTSPLLLATALAMGALHAFDVDHLAAVTTFIARRPSSRSAAAYAVRWGLGHSATLLAVGLATNLFSFALTPGMRTAAELAVGGMLILLGLWTFRRQGPRVEHHRSVFWVGVVHGLAGSAGLMLILPVALISPAWSVTAFILTFSLGVTLAMMVYALAVGGMLGRVAGGAGARWYPWLSGAAGSCTILLGLAWISATLAARGA